MAQLKLRKLDKNGSAIYAIDNVRGSLWISKTMLKTEAPAVIDVGPEVFADPGAAPRLSGPRNATPEQIEKVRAQAAKAEERAAKARDRAEKARQRAEKYANAQEPVAV